jgi:multiple sugar transport system ATP-binding protein
MNLLNGEMEIAGIRPEHVRFDDGSGFRGHVLAHEYSGADTFVRIATPRGELIARCSAADTLPAPGSEVGIGLPANFLRRFDRTTGDLLK